MRNCMVKIELNVVKENSIVISWKRESENNKKRRIRAGKNVKEKQFIIRTQKPERKCLIGTAEN
jgi:hypothetical protein